MREDGADAGGCDHHAMFLGGVRSRLVSAATGGRRRGFSLAHFGLGCGAFRGASSAVWFFHLRVGRDGDEVLTAFLKPVASFLAERVECSAARLSGALFFLGVEDGELTEWIVERFFVELALGDVGHAAGECDAAVLARVEVCELPCVDMGVRGDDVVSPLEGLKTGEAGEDVLADSSNLGGEFEDVELDGVERREADDWLDRADFLERDSEPVLEFGVSGDVEDVFLGAIPLSERIVVTRFLLSGCAREGGWFQS